MISLPAAPNAGPGKDRPEARSRALLLVAAIVLVAVAAGVLHWEPWNPWRAGSTHDAELLWTSPPCTNGWMVSLGERRWQAKSMPPVQFGEGPVEGTLRIDGEHDATFTTADFSTEMWGGKDVFFHLNCSIDESDPRTANHPMGG